MKAAEGLEKFVWNAPGYAPLAETPHWLAALLNWEPGMTLKQAEQIERHERSDEVFVLIKGKAAIYTVCANDSLEVTEMQVGAIYNVLAGVWHNVLASADASFVIVENSGTNVDGTELRPMTAHEIERLHAHAPGWAR